MGDEYIKLQSSGKETIENNAGGQPKGVADGQVEMTFKESTASSSTTSPSSVESQKSDDVDVAEVKPMIWIGQAAMMYALGASSYAVVLIGPRKLGFFCGDESIRMPYRDSSIPVYWLYLVCYVFLVATLIVVECLCQKYRYPRYVSKLATIFKLNEFIVPGAFVRIVKFFLISQLGFNIERFLLNTTKYSIGRLRPNFLAVCKPSVNTSTIASCGDAATYIRHYVCLGKDDYLIRDGRLSFYSGHTSQSFYFAVFLVLYMHSRFGRTRRTSVLFPIIYAILIISAALVGYSRINDNKHHVTDVIAGALFGTAIAVFMFVLFYRQFVDIQFDQPKEISLQRVTMKDVVDNLSLCPSATVTVHTQTTNASTTGTVTVNNSARASHLYDDDEIINVSESEAFEIHAGLSRDKPKVLRQPSSQPIVVKPRILNDESNM